MVGKINIFVNFFKNERFCNKILAFENAWIPIHPWFARRNDSKTNNFPNDFSSQFPALGVKEVDVGVTRLLVEETQRIVKKRLREQICEVLLRKLLILRNVETLLAVGARMAHYWSIDQDS